MFCHKCGHKLGEFAKFCTNCGASVSVSHYDEKKEHTFVYKGKYSRVRSPVKFLTLYFATFGLYPLFWMYDQWYFLKKAQNLKISPGWRAFFSTIWAGSLAGHAEEFLKKEGVNVGYNSVLIGVSYFILAITYKAPDPYWLITLLSFLPVLPILAAMNEYYKKHDKSLVEAKLAWWQCVLVGLGLILMFFTIYDTLYPQ